MADTPKLIGISKADYPFGAQYNRSAFASSFRFHHHSAFEFYIFLQGKVRILIENMFFEAAPNNLFLYPPNSLHGLISQDDSCGYERMYFHVEPELLARFGVSGYSLLKPVEQAAKESRLLYTLSDSEVEHLLGVITVLESLKQQPETPMNDLERYQLLFDAMLLIVKVIESQNQASPETQFRKHPFMSDVLSYINDNFTSELSLEDIARYANVSKYHLSHEFKKLTDTSVVNYIIIKRLLYSVKLMKSGVSPSNACFQCGFSSYSNYQKAFRQYFGVSPSQHADAPLHPIA